MRFRAILLNIWEITLWKKEYVFENGKRENFFYFFLFFFRAHRTKRSDQKTRKGRAVWVRRTRKALSRKREMLSNYSTCSIHDDKRKVQEKFNAAGDNWLRNDTSKKTEYYSFCSFFFCSFFIVVLIDREKKSIVPHKCIQDFNCITQMYIGFPSYRTDVYRISIVPHKCI